MTQRDRRYATGTMCALQFKALGEPRSEVDLAVLYVDHNVLRIDERNKDDHRYSSSTATGWRGSR